MADAVPLASLAPTPAGPRPGVRLELRQGTARPLFYDVSDAGFLIGSVPGCDLRLPGADLPPVVCLIVRHGSGASIRRLAPAQPVLVNGRPISTAPLAAGDAITLGAVQLLLHVSGPPEPGPRTGGNRLKAAANLDARELEVRQEAAQLEAARRQLLEQVAQLQQDRQAFEAEVLQRGQALAARRQELEAGHQELAGIRQELYDRYRQRRDRLAGLREAISRAAHKVQERKRAVDAESERLRHSQQEAAACEVELTAREDEVARARQLLDEQQRLFQVRQQELRQELADRLAECQAREDRLAEDRQALEAGQAQHQADLVRLDRLQHALDQRDHELQARAQEIDARLEQLQRDSRDLEEQAQQLDAWHTQLSAQAEHLAQQQADQEAAGSQLDQRAAALEGQQALLAALRTRLERKREELRSQEQQLAEQRSRQETAEADLRQHLQEVQQLRDQLEADVRLGELERRQFEERGAVLEAAVAQLRQAQEAQATEDERLRQRAAELDATAAEQAETASLLQARSAQLGQLQERLAADRQALRDREASLAEAEQAREALQEQLRRRSEDLAARQRALAEHVRAQADEAAAVAAHRADLDRERRTTEEQLAGQRQELAERDAELAQREEVLRRHIERLKGAGRTLGAKRKTLGEEHGRREVELRSAAEAVARARVELEAAKAEVVQLQRQYPEVEQQARSAAERLALAREQLREHLAQVHAYARQSHDDLEALRRLVQAEAEQVRQQTLALHQARDEHRLAVAAFRQQLIDWQAQVAEMRRSLVQGEAQLGLRQAQVEEQARQVDATTARLALQAEQLQEQERAVAERRDEMDRHLKDMREWYRRKLRELSQRYRADEERGPTNEGMSAAAEDAAPATADPRSSILSLTGDVEPGDRQLGELLQSLGLVDAETLTTLFVEARKQRRSLRQALLASGDLTLYQLALIEAGNLDGLILGPLRVVDRLRVTPRETVYRVFDSRRSQEASAVAVLRHLSEAEAADAVRPDEFRQRFAAAAALRHPHLAATWEVLEIHGRPAVLQEWVAGLASSEWPALAAVPGVWFRLLSQAALGLHATHQAGLVHGHLDAGLLVLTGEGTLKLCGLGEPPWLAAGSAPPAPEGDTAADLATLGRIAAGWAALGAGRKGAKARPPPGPLQAILHRLTGAADPPAPYASAAELLEDLDRAGPTVPPNAEAWERLLRHVREHATDEPPLRRSA
jgi:chromosome segregation ATPase